MLKIEWKFDNHPVAYDEAVNFMEDRVDKIIKGQAANLIWVTQHPALYTAGISAKDNELLRNDIPVFKTNRGGKYTYHGPGVKIIYVMLNLKEVFTLSLPDVRIFVKKLENWIIEILQNFNIKGIIKDGRVGIWVNAQNTEKKIAAIGIKLTKWVSYHGLAINIDPDLSAFKGIVPCGIDNFGVTSIKAINKKVPEGLLLDEIIKNSFYNIFNS